MYIEIEDIFKSILEGDEFDRYKRGFMSDFDQVNYLRAYAWGDLDRDLHRFNGINWNDIDHVSPELCRGDEIFVEPNVYSGTLSQIQYKAYAHIEKIFSGNKWSVFLFIHECNCGMCSRTCSVVCARVEQELCGHLLNKEYLLY